MDTHVVALVQYNNSTWQSTIRHFDGRPVFFTVLTAWLAEPLPTGTRDLF